MLTLSMIVKDEENYLEDCLNSVKGLADEIVIVDTGSQDGTKLIARKHNAKMYDFTWCDDFSEARNFALSKSSGDWILYLDADERLSGKSIPELKKIITSKDKLAVYCSVKSINAQTKKNDLMRYPRLFRHSDGIKFTGTIHEQIIRSLEEKAYKKIYSNIEIIHLGYDVTSDEIKKKASRNLKYLLKELETEYTTYNLFKISQTYNALGDRENAKLNYESLINLKNCEPVYLAQAYNYLAACELVDHNFNKGLEYASNGLRIDRTNPFLNLIAAKLHFNIGGYENTILHCKRALEPGTLDQVKDFELCIDEKEAVYSGLEAAITLNDVNSFNHFFKLLNDIDNTELKNNDLLNAINLLINNSAFNPKYIDIFAGLVERENLKSVLQLIDNYSDTSVKIILLQKLSLKFELETDVLNAHGKALCESKMFDKAAEVFERSIEIEMKNPSVIFYLISCYVQTGRSEDLAALIEKHESKLSQFPQLAGKIKAIKNQLKPQIK